MLLLLVVVVVLLMLLMSLVSQDLLDKVTTLQEFCNKKDKFLQVDTICRATLTLRLMHVLQSTKMILKFREAHISNLEKNRRAAATPNDPTPSSDALPSTSPTPDTTTTVSVDTVENRCMTVETLYPTTH